MKLIACCAAFALPCCIFAQAAVDTRQLEQSLSLRENWMSLTRDVPLDPKWAAERHQFHYKLTVEGGFMFYGGQRKTRTSL